MVKLKFLRFFLFLAFFTIYHLPFTIYQSFAQDKIIAIVNNEVITQKELDDFLNFMRLQLSGQLKGRELENKIQSLKLDLLDRLIEDRLILQEARQAKINVAADRVEERLQEVKKRYGSQREFQQALAKQGLVQADIERKIREQLMTFAIIDQKIRSKILVTPKEVTDFYAENSQEFIIPEERQSQTLIIDNAEEAQQVYREWKNGVSQEGLAAKYRFSTDTLTAVKGQELRPEIEEVIFKLRPQEISPPVKIDQTYYIFQLKNIIPPRKQTLLETQDQIYTFLTERKMQEAMAKWLTELKKHAFIKILQD